MKPQLTTDSLDWSSSRLIDAFPLAPLVASYFSPTSGGNPRCALCENGKLWWSITSCGCSLFQVQCRLWRHKRRIPNDGDLHYAIFIRLINDTFSCFNDPKVNTAAEKCRRFRFQGLCLMRFNRLDTWNALIWSHLPTKYFSKTCFESTSVLSWCEISAVIICNNDN